MTHLRPTLLLALWPALASAGALTDGSTGAVQSLSGQFTVPQSLGTVRGANLFHSFTRFGIGTGESATFSTSDAGIRHVIGRVTGGDASTLQGPLRLQAAAGGRPDFWLVNPNGITVGAGASFDVPAGLHLSTAQQLRFADGLAWDSRGGTPSTLSVAAPETFGFLGPQPAAALRWRDSELTLQPGSTLDLAGGSVTVQFATLAAPGGRIRIQSPGAVELSGRAGLYASSGTAADSGSIRIDAGSLTLDAQAGFASLLTETAPGLAPGNEAIALRVAGALQMLGGADITATNESQRPGGRLSIRADTMTVDGLGQKATNIRSYALSSGAGPAIDIDVAGRLVFNNGGQVFAATAASGDSGGVSLRAGTLAMDGQGNFAFVGAQVLDMGSGRAGPVELRVRDALTMLGGAQIVSDPGAAGGSGPLAINAGSIRLDNGGDFPSTRLSTGPRNYGAGPMQIDAALGLDVVNGASIASFSRAGLAPAELRVRARTITLDGGGIAPAEIVSLSSDVPPSGAVSVEAGERLVIARGGQISSATLSSSASGSIHVKAPLVEMTGGGAYTTSISSTSLLPQGGNSGDVHVEASTLNLKAGATIHSDTMADQGHAGRVTVLADSIMLDGTGLASGIRSQAWGQASNGGTVVVTAREQLTVRDGANIIAGTLGRGDPGRISVTAPTLLVDGKGAPDTFTGIAGDVVIGAGAGAAVSVDAGRLTVRNGGSISSSTFTSSNAGSVRINADVITVDGGDRSHATGISADSGGAGNAGNLSLSAREITLSNEALVSTSTLSSGRGGALAIDAGSLTVNSSSTIASVAGGSGAAGNIDLRVADALVLREGGSIGASTGSSGAAGRVTISAGSFLASGFDAASGFKTFVVSRAGKDSGGQPGSITLNVRGNLQLLDGAALSIANAAQVADPGLIVPTTLSVQAGQIQLSDSEITAASSGNANAGRITLGSTGSMLFDRSSVRTSSLDGDGGPIALNASGLVRLRDSRITTSVEGRSNGNGGDITLAASALVLESGFIQANTSAPLARGGDVRVDVRTLLPNGSQVFIGGNRVEGFRPGVAGFNVIQAAAPEGLSGALDVSIPQLNLSGSLVGLSTAMIDFGLLGRDACQIGTQSSLTLLGRGSAASTANGPLRIEP